VDGDIIARMRAEEAELSRKLKAVQSFLAAYGADTGDSSGPAPRKANPTSSREKVGIDGFGSYGRTVVAEAMRMLLLSPHPVKTRDLIAPIEAMGVTITGENKINALGALLARSIDITSHGKGGWSIANTERAYEIVSQYGHKENEAPSETAGASDAAGWGAPTPSPAPVNPNPWPSA
jgi:hypothetical protein